MFTFSILTKIKSSRFDILTIHLVILSMLFLLQRNNKDSKSFSFFWVYFVLTHTSMIYYFTKTSNIYRVSLVIKEKEQSLRRTIYKKKYFGICIFLRNINLSGRIKSVSWVYSSDEEYSREFKKRKAVKYSLLLAVLLQNWLDPSGLFSQNMLVPFFKLSFWAELIIRFWYEWPYLRFGKLLKNILNTW